jgi:ssDNA-binding Zn-finger/Zn-ribbon topoisomerase 1
MPRGQDAFGKWNFHKVTYSKCPNCDKKGLHMHTYHRGKATYGCKYCGKLQFDYKVNKQTT